MNTVDDVEALGARFDTARRSGADLAVLEGFHAIKHCLRFGGRIDAVVSPEPEAVVTLANELAPDVAAPIAAQLQSVTFAEFERLCPRPPASPVAALAPRQRHDVHTLFEPSQVGHAVLLEDPRHPGNVGAVIRVAAAADATAVFTTGSLDPWHPAVIRGAAGLHFAVAVGSAPSWDAVGATAAAPRTRQLVALDPDGVALDCADVEPNAVLAFGTERHGLSASLLTACDLRVALPMREGVSSLNLATAVAATLYALRFAL